MCARDGSESVEIGYLTVWEQYRNLHRYVSAAPTVAGAKVPSHLSTKPYGRAEDACNEIAADINLVRSESPDLRVSSDYFCYLYLFAQLLRCSTLSNPHWLPESGWTNLGWFPLVALHGRHVDSRDQSTAIRFWRYWLRQTHLPQMPIDHLESLFPVFSSDINASTKAIHEQLGTLLELRRQYNGSDTDLLRLMTSQGPLGRGRCFWHPMLLLSNVHAWIPPDAIVEAEFQTIRPYLEAILTKKRLCAMYVGVFIPIANRHSDWRQRQVHAVIRDGIDDLVACHLHSHHKQWENLRRRYFPEGE